MLRRVNRTDPPYVSPIMRVAGLPLHPIVVHAVVVLIPLAALGALLVAAWRRAYGVPTLVLAVAGLLSVPLATTSGNALAAEHGGHGSDALTLHMDRADRVLPTMLVFVVLLAAALWLGRRTDQSADPDAATGAPSGGTAVATRTTSTRLVPVLAVLAAVAGLVATWFVVLTGHAGATSVWGS